MAALSVVAILLLLLLGWFQGRNRWFATEPAHLELVNLCDRDWKIIATGTRRGAAQRWEIAAGATVLIDIPADEYRIDQTLLTEAKNTGPTRTFSMRVEAGERYRWKLLSLLSEDGTGRAQP